MTPALVTAAPSPVAPCASSASIHEPDSRVSRPTRIRGDCVPCGRARTTAAPSRRTVAWSRGWWPARPRTPSVPNSRSVFDTGNPHLHGRGFDARDARALLRVDADGEHVFAFAQSADVHRRREVVGADSADDVTAPADPGVHDGGHGLRGQPRAEVAQTDGKPVKVTFHRSWRDPDLDVHGALRLQPERRIEQADGD